MKIAVRLVKIDHVEAFRRALIALYLFVTGRRSAQRNAIVAKQSAVSENFHPVDTFLDDDAVGDAAEPSTA